LESLLMNLRFIPAPAGNATQVATPARSTAVHPRACGERQAVISQEMTTPRFIPAPAGNARAQICKLYHPVHPRACGERLWRLVFCLYSGGSSPRLRGTHH